MTINKELKIIILYPIFFGLIILLLTQLFYPGLLNSQNFLNADAGHYSWIRINGYEGFRVAFFPLFPLIWKTLSVGIYGIVIFNAVLFLFSFYLLIRALKATPWETVLYLSIPGFIFFYFPFSESVFFAASTILLIGLMGRKVHFILIGLLLSTLARPAFAIFIPALVITEFFGEKIIRQTFIRLMLYLAVILAGICIVGLVQYIYTGEWFRFFSVQEEWGNKLQVPKLPLTSWAGGLIVRLDGAALLFGVTAGIVLLLWIFKFRIFKMMDIPKEVVFSLAYLAGISISVLLFRGGCLFSLNRFVFAVPFIIVAVNFLKKQDIRLNYRNLLTGFLLIFIFFLLFGSYNHIQNLLNFMLLSLYLSLILVIKSRNDKVSRYAMILLTGINIFFQIFFYIRFLNGGWIG
jgi:hypothetical protein